MHFINRQTCNQQIGCVIEVEGRIDKERYVQAAKLAMKAEPILGCRFVERFWRPYWEPRSDLDPNSLEFFDCVETDEVEEAVIDFFVNRLCDPVRGPLFRIRLIRRPAREGAPPEDVIAYKISHVLGDWGGVRELSFAVNAIYKRLFDDPDYVPPVRPTWRSRASRSMRQVFRNMGWRQRLQVWKRGRKDFLKQSLWRLPFNNGPESNPTYVIKRIDAETTAKILKSAKARRATLNEMLLAAYFRALCEWGGVADGTSLSMTDTIDLRHYLPGKRTESICNMSAPMAPLLQHKVDEPFSDLVTRVVAEMRQQKRSSPGLLPAAVIGAMFQTPFGLMANSFRKLLASTRAEGGSVPVLSDGGYIQMEVHGVDVKLTYGVGPVTYPPNIIFITGIFRDVMIWTVGVCESAAPKAEIAGLLDRMEDLIVNASSVVADPASKLQTPSPPLSARSIPKAEAVAS